MAINAESRNPYKDKSYTELLPIINEKAKKITAAAESVAKCDKDPKTHRDVVPATDDAGLMLLALSVFKTEYGKKIRQWGGSDDRIEVIKTLGREARNALRLSLKKMEELTRALVDADEFLDIARDAYYDKHGKEIDEKAEAMEKRAKKIADDAAALRAAKGSKGRKSATANG